MARLFKGRYLIALYDEEDNLVEVADNPRKLMHFKNRPKSFYEQRCRGDKRMQKCKVFLIDCLEKHDDVFAEEDEIFLEEYKAEINNYKSIDEKMQEIANEIGVSKRTIYRWKSNGKLEGYIKKC